MDTTTISKLVAVQWGKGQLKTVVTSVPAPKSALHPTLSLWYTNNPRLPGTLTFLAKLLQHPFTLYESHSS